MQQDQCFNFVNSFVTLLEYAEDSLKCSHVIVCFKKDRQDRCKLRWSWS